MSKYIEAYEAHKNQAEAAFTAFRCMTRDDLPRVPGMATVIRLAWRLECGRDVETAVAREYLYRWSLALGAPDQIALGGQAWLMLGAPHLIGM